MTDFDVAVVGAGIAGAAAARALARAGARTVLVEQFAVGHRRGSSHGTSRIFRFSYGDPVYVRDCMESLPLWRALEEETGTRLYTRTGGFDLGEHALLHRGALEECGARSEMLDAEEAARRYPGVAFPDDIPILFQPDAGISHADVCVRACLWSAKSHGAELREGIRIDRLEQDGDGVTLRASAERLRVRVAVVAAGAWARTLLARSGMELDVAATRETVAYFPFDEGATVPSMVEWTATPSFFALWAPGVGMKAGWHHAGPVLDDPDVPGGIDRRTVEEVGAWVGRRFPAADPRPVHAETCLYTNTSDKSFILQREGRVVVGSACSGHGFKFGPLTGLRLAALAQEAL